MKDRTYIVSYYALKTSKANKKTTKKTTKRSRWVFKQDETNNMFDAMYHAQSLKSPSADIIVKDVKLTIKEDE